MWEIRQGDWIERLREMPDESVQCVVTSPPYWGLRDYGTARWEGGEPTCEHIASERWYTESTAAVSSAGAFSLPGEANADRLRRGRWREKGHCLKCGAVRIDGQLGLERTPEEYVAKMVEGFREVRRVLRSDGTLWLNLGDTYNSQNGFQRGNDRHLDGGIPRVLQYPDRSGSGVKTKDLVGIPWMVAFALRSDGWYLRQDIIWNKPNPMPESTRDRCTKAHEYIFLMSKCSRYFYDQDAILEPVSAATHARLSQDVQSQIGRERGNGGAKPNGNMKAVGRKLAPSGSGIKNNDSFDAAMAIMPESRNKRSVWTITTKGYSEAHFATFPPEIPEICIKAGCPEGGIVLDPFAGAGTTGLVATRLNRNFIGIELNPDYCEIARRRIEQDAPLFNIQSQLTTECESC